MPIPNGMPKPRHLGDGCYIHFDGFQFWFTANHHDPDMATDKVALPVHSVDEVAAYRDHVREFFSN